MALTIGYDYGHTADRQYRSSVKLAKRGDIGAAFKLAKEAKAHAALDRGQKRDEVYFGQPSAALEAADERLRVLSNWHGRLRRGIARQEGYSRPQADRALGAR
jgi:hypothetical protein